MGQDTAPAPAVHLVILQHGLWGNTTCVSNLEAFLRQQLGPQAAAAADQQGSTPADGAQQQQLHEEVQILNSDVNRKALTYDGELLHGLGPLAPWHMHARTLAKWHFQGRHFWDHANTQEGQLPCMFS